MLIKQKNITEIEQDTKTHTNSYAVAKRPRDVSYLSVVNVIASIVIYFERSFYRPFASIAKGEVFVLLYVFLYVCMYVRSTISRQPAGRFTQKFACRRTLVPDVSSPLLGVGGPRRAEKEANEIFVTMGVNGEFLHFGGF